MKYALFDKATGAVRQWQDHDRFGFADAPPDELLQLPDDFEFPTVPCWVIGGAISQSPSPGVTPTGPTHAELVDRARAETRAQRLPIMSVLDGLQISAVTLGDGARAMVIETAKAGLRGLTEVDLSACVTFEDMRLAVKARYIEIAGAVPVDIRKAFAEALQ
ncbi:hypothetical protein LJR084_001935 [Variovorax sp. LjRoot84]|uniref:hypothetical protein n=1 Tax=Variovorax sp. LjRoot84 TaxID=3342340 RepID=UPI003ECF3E6D